MLVVLAVGEHDRRAALCFAWPARDCAALRRILAECCRRPGALAAIPERSMSKRFQRGLVVGKFAPIHRGHEHLIRHAFDNSDEVVIISYCKPEFAGCEAE